MKTGWYGVQCLSLYAEYEARKAKKAAAVGGRQMSEEVTGAQWRRAYLDNARIIELRDKEIVGLKLRVRALESELDPQYPQTQKSIAGAQQALDVVDECKMRAMEWFKMEISKSKNGDAIFVPSKFLKYL